MRRTRELSAGHYVAITISGLGAAFGIYTLVSHRHRASEPTVAVIKPSQFKAGETAPKTESGHYAGAKAEEAEEGEESGHNREIASSRGEQGAPMVSHRAKAAGSPHGKKLASSEGEPVAGPSAELDHAATEVADNGHSCSTVEYRGDSPENITVTQEDWRHVQELFWQSKASLLSWVEEHKTELPGTTVTAMTKQVKELKMVRPNNLLDEPDLAWRGIGIYSQGNVGEPQVKMGAGFVKFALKNPSRAAFEMTRLVAQSWSPCELSRAAGPDAGNTWQPLLKCLGGSDAAAAQAAACPQGSFSEAGWAISTTFASKFSPPSCEIRAFQAPEFAKCVKSIPLTVARSVASEEKHQ
jgi:hypothetical protein